MWGTKFYTHTRTPTHDRPRPHAQVNTRMNTCAGTHARTHARTHTHMPLGVGFTSFRPVPPVTSVSTYSFHFHLCFPSLQSQPLNPRSSSFLFFPVFSFPWPVLVSFRLACDTHDQTISGVVLLLSMLVSSFGLGLPLFGHF